MKEVEQVLNIIGIMILIVLILGLPVQILWNLLMPELFGLPIIGFWQAVGLNFLSTLLFKSNININKK
jgi:hypothetical protein